MSHIHCAATAERALGEKEYPVSLLNTGHKLKLVSLSRLKRHRYTSPPRNTNTIYIIYRDIINAYRISQPKNVVIAISGNNLLL